MSWKCPCGTQTIYNLPGETKPICCKKCKTDEMVDVVHERCPCGKSRPVYNVPGEKKGVCCAKCKTDEMINVVNKRCPCGSISPSFNVPGQTKGVCCKKCKTPEMVDVVSKRCPCGTHPKFNLPGQTKGVCCAKCKTDDMVDVVHMRCPCGSLTPTFNVPGETFGVCCAKCKTAEMVDVVHPKCPCGKQPCFNVPGETIGICCVKCKTDEMIDVVNVNKICPGYDEPCRLRTRLTKGHDYCMSCDPNDARRKIYKRHEEAFFAYVKDEIDVHKREFRVSFDPEYTSKKFAKLDGIVFGDGIVVCLEVDENGHRDYECDEHRMHLVTAELLQQYPDRVVSWVRVNPTVDAKNDWSKKSKAIREKRFEDVVIAVNDILESRETRVVYIGFDDV
jgi:hypothetical protein